MRVYVTELLLDGWTDFDEIFCVSSRGFEDGLDSQFGPLENVYLSNFSFISSCCIEIFDIGSGRLRLPSQHQIQIVTAY